MATDFAALAQRHAWFRQPFLADPSWDAWEAVGGGPLWRGGAGLEWPVNCFLFIDPADGAWYGLIGCYPTGYAFAPPPGHMQCQLVRSRDQGASWTRLGPLFPDPWLRFAGVDRPAPHHPDAALCHADGRYHLVFDWVTDNARWGLINNSCAGIDSGVGYAWAERPEGPWHPSPTPLVLNRDLAAARPAGFTRAYASTLVRRAHDWLLLVAVDAGPHMAWGLLAATAARPEGPYSAPQPVLHPGRGAWQPGRMEFFPQFTDQGRVLAPATALWRNRDHQCLFSAAIEDAHREQAWSAEEDGSLWHTPPGADRQHGLWGQTFAAAAVADGWAALHPSRDRDGHGTIACARLGRARQRDRGFACAAHEGAGLAVLGRSAAAFSLDAAWELEGSAALLWGHQAVVGLAGGHHHDDLVEPGLGDACALEFDPGHWRLSHAGAGARATVAEGARVDGTLAFRLAVAADGGVVLECAGGCHQVVMPAVTGRLALLLAPGARLRCRRLTIEGAEQPAWIDLAATVALAGAGAAVVQADQDLPGLAALGWRLEQDSFRLAPAPDFRGGLAARRRAPGGRGRWDFRGDAARLWSPRGPGLGRIALALDGQPVGTVDLRAAHDQASAPVWERELAPGLHVLEVSAADHPLTLDCLQVRCCCGAGRYHRRR
jgi:hypothetical protein